MSQLISQGYSKCSKILNTSLSVLKKKIYIKMMVIRGEIHKMVVRIANREDPDHIWVCHVCLGMCGRASVFGVMGLKVFGRVGTHIFFSLYFFPENLIFLKGKFTLFLKCIYYRAYSMEGIIIHLMCVKSLQLACN